VVAEAPLAIVAVTVTAPAPVVFNTLPLMLAPVSPALLTDHVMVWLVALGGDTVPLRVSGIPTVVEVGTLLMFVTAMKVPPLSGGSPQAAKVNPITATRAIMPNHLTMLCNFLDIIKHSFSMKYIRTENSARHCREMRKRPFGVAERLNCKWENICYWGIDTVI
jgi:hypothetical protein